MTKEYYECHITIDPVLDNDKLKTLKELSKSCNFRVAELLMKKNGEYALSDMDSFLTARDPDKHDIHNKMVKMCELLKDNEFVIRRYKIEYAYLDSKSMGDIYELL